MDQRQKTPQNRIHTNNQAEQLEDSTRILQRLQKHQQQNDDIEDFDELDGGKPIEGNSSRLNNIDENDLGDDDDVE